MDGILRHRDRMGHAPAPERDQIARNPLPAEQTSPFGRANPRPREHPSWHDHVVTLPAAHVVTDLARTGALRAAINLGNPLLAQGTPEAPSGVTVDLAREVGRRLGVPVRFVCFDAARKSFEAMREGHADICFLAIEPARMDEVAFTAPYVIIEGVFVVPDDSEISTPAEVDRDGVRVGVKQGSAYDLYLSRTLQCAEVVRGNEGVDVFRELGLEVGAGIRQPAAAWVGRNPGFRVVTERFMEIQQAVGTTRNRGTDTVRFLTATVEELKASGFVEDALHRSGQAGATVAPLADDP
jgi:polar amino acid transport system substrate-binding protein